MTDALDIGRLATRVRGADPDQGARLAEQVRAVLDGPLAQDLDGVAARALARAGLPAGAVVAVRRVALRLRIGPRVQAAELGRAWAEACETALVGALAGASAGIWSRISPARGHADPGGGWVDSDLVWFPDPWAAELAHLERLAAGQPPPWWAQRLAAGAGATAEALSPATILARWVAQDPARAVATMTALAESGTGVVTLLDVDQARGLTRALLGRLALPPIAGVGRDAAQASRAAGSVLLDQALARVQGLAATLAAQGGVLAWPWLAAALFARSPALTGVPGAWVESLLELATEAAAHPPDAGPPDAGPMARAAARPAGPGKDTRSAVERWPPISARAQLRPGPAVTVAPASQTWSVCAGGLLLLVRPLAKLGLLPAAPSLTTGLADLALTALRRVLASLPPGDLAVAQERERPLLAVLAPEFDWRGRIAETPIADPGTAADLLATLVALIPADIAFAPGAARLVFGTPTPSIARAEDLRLARLVLRPGRLRLTPWEAELTWPLAAADLALRRGGWDQDPGWVPWLGRNLSFRFGGEA